MFEPPKLDGLQREAKKLVRMTENSKPHQGSRGTWKKKGRIIRTEKWGRTNKIKLKPSDEGPRRQGRPKIGRKKGRFTDLHMVLVTKRPRSRGIGR